MYADDLKVYTVVQTNDDCIRLQHQLGELVAWSNDWQLSISLKKCQFLSVGLKKLAFSYMLGDFILPKVVFVNDLGVTIDDSCQFAAHIGGIVTKAHARVNLIFRCFVSRDIATLTRAFITYVRPMLEYASTVWSPSHITLIKKIESVQRRFSKRLHGLANISYQQRLTALDLESLERRRLRADLITTYKIIFSLLDVNAAQFFTFPNNPVTRGHRYRITRTRFRVDVRRHSFAIRVIEPWNNLPEDHTNFTNLSTFKSSLKKIDLSKYTHF